MVIVRPLRALALFPFLALSAAGQPQDIPTTAPGAALAQAQAAAVASFLTQKPGQPYADEIVKIPAAPASFQAVLSGIRDVQEGCSLPCTSDADIAAYGARIDSLAGKLGLAADVPALHSNYMPGGNPRKRAAAEPRNAAARRLDRSAFTPDLAANVQLRSQTMAAALGAGAASAGPLLMSADQLQRRSGLPLAQTAMLRRLAPPPPAPPVAVPHKALSWLHVNNFWHDLKPKALMSVVLMELQMHPENQAKTMSGWGLGLSHLTGLSGIVETGIYVATLPFQTMALRYAAKKEPPLTHECIAVDLLVQKGAIPNAELTQLYSNWNGRWRFETTAGLKHEPATPPAGQELKDQQILSAESVKAATSDMGFQQYLMNLPQYKDKVAQETAALQKAGPQNEMNELINAGLAHEIPSKDSGTKSAEYETKLYNGKVVPNAMQTVKSMLAVAANIIPGVSEYRVGVLELETLRDPTLTKTEKTFDTVRNFAGTVGMAMALVTPVSSIIPFLISEGADLMRRAWHARMESVCAWQHCDGEGEPGYPQPAPAPAAALP